jgi:hypothetical protein
MKKKIFFIVVLIAGIISAINANVMKNKSGDISLINIEVLSSGEKHPGINCFSIGSLDCSVSETKVYMIW